MLNATELLNGSVEKHARWQILQDCADWAQQQCRAAPSELENESLTAVLSGIHVWLAMPRTTEWELRKQNYTQHRKAICEEVTAFVRNLNDMRIRRPLEIRCYAFTQHALRELRAHTSRWTDARKATQPTGLLGRAGHEHTRATASEIIGRRTHWPFHLAGDSGACLFDHRAWVSWRFLALLELPSLSLCELPSLSKDLQALIEATRSSAETGEPLSARTVEEILFAFSHDPACADAKAVAETRSEAYWKRMEKHCG